MRVTICDGLINRLYFFFFFSFSVSDKPTNVRHTQLREQQYSRKKKKIAPQPPSLVSSVTVPGIERVIRLSVEEIAVKTRNFKLSLFSFEHCIMYADLRRF